jgi:Dihaem cytochrome c
MVRRPSPSRKSLHRLAGNSMRRRSPLTLFLLLLVWSLILGWGLAQTLQAQPAAAPSPTEIGAEIGTVDVVPERYQLGQRFYLENCATCHVGLPPAVMASQTWAALIQDNQHYGAQITPLTPPALEITWEYLSTFSRPVMQRERIPFRLPQSRFFKALHPRVTFSEPIGVGSCVACHPAAAQFNYRQLTPEWENSP